jgi:hypothetical protein
MNDMEQLYRQARGLQRTAQNIVNSGKGDKPAESIVRLAAELLISGVNQANGHDPTIRSLEVYPEITWSEILTIATAICNHTNQGEQ